MADSDAGPRPATAAAVGELRRDPVVLALLAACGSNECHLVGGALRDRALGLATRDLDAVVAGRGREIADELATRLPARLVLLGGKDFAAYRLVLAAGAGRAPRRDSTGAGAAAEQASASVLDLWDRGSTPLYDDLARRDFTVNSFALEPRGGMMIDPFGGVADLERRRLRATARASFEGDPLRVLRLARLLVRLPGFAVDPETRELARRAAPRLAEMAAERIREELWLLFSHPDAARGLLELAALGVYPGLWLDTGSAPTGERAAELAATEIAALPARAGELLDMLGTGAGGAAPGVEPEPPIDFTAARLAATFRHLPPEPRAAGPRPSAGAGWGEPAAVLTRMRDAGYLSVRHAAEIAPLLAAPAELPATELDRRRFLHGWGRRWLTTATSFGGAAAAAGQAALDRWRHAAAPLCELARREGPALIAPPRLLDGEDVQRLIEVPAGPQVGAALAALTAAQVDGAVRTSDDAERFLRGWRERSEK
jgi:poly(A) polymerase